MAERVSHLSIFHKVLPEVTWATCKQLKKETRSIAFKSLPHAVILNVCLRRNKPITTVIHSLIDKNAMIKPPYN